MIPKPSQIAGTTLGPIVEGTGQLTTGGVDIVTPGGAHHGGVVRRHHALLETPHLTSVRACIARSREGVEG